MQCQIYLISDAAAENRINVDEKSILRGSKIIAKSNRFSHRRGGVPETFPERFGFQICSQGSLVGVILMKNPR
jgi:hypothetical protein